MAVIYGLKYLRENPQKLQISPLRFASVEMTKGSGAVAFRLVTGGSVGIAFAGI